MFYGYLKVISHIVVDNMHNKQRELCHHRDRVFV